MGIRGPAAGVAVALGLLFSAGGIVRADGPGNEPSACYSYKEAKARWQGAYLTWRRDDRQWICWAPKGRHVSHETAPPPRQRVAHVRRPVEDVEPVEPSLAVDPDLLAWVWQEASLGEPEPFRPMSPMGVYSTFPPGEEPDVWPVHHKKSPGLLVPAIVALMLAFLAGSLATVIAAVGVEAILPRRLSGLLQRRNSA